MTKYHRNILIDQRTSCTTDQAAALLLKRRSWDPIYRDQNPDADPEVVHEQFMEWLDISIFEELMEERDGLLMALDDALGDEENQRDEAQVTLCKERIVQCDDTIRRAHLILCDIDDELAKGTESKLIKDPVATERSGCVHLTRSSLKQWADGKNYLSLPLDATQAQNASPARLDTEIDEPLLDPEGGMSPTSARSFLVTFAVLLDEYVKATGKQFIAENGTGIVEERIAAHLNKMSYPTNEGKRTGYFLYAQSVSVIETRIKCVISDASYALEMARRKAKAKKSK